LVALQSFNAGPGATESIGASLESLTFLLGRIKQTEVVGEAPDGHQAVELAEKLAPAVVIMDVAMPFLTASMLLRRF